MKTAVKLFAAGLLLAGAANTLADMHYVDVNSTSATSPYTNWTTAATNIQDAVDAAVAGDEIVVANGIYATGERTVNAVTTNRVAVDKPIMLRSLYGPQSTIIDGGGVSRCVYLTNGASLCGFTLTNGRAQQGGGLWCESADAVVSNCVVSGNSSFGAIRFLNVGSPCCNLYHTFAGGVYGGTLYYSTLSGNWAETYNFLGFRCDRSTCTATGDGHIQAYYSFGAGGGAADATLNNCTLTANRADSGGGAYGCTLNNCTLAGNSGGYGGTYSSTLNNCIVYFNDGGNYDPSSTLNYSCTTPLPTNGVGNITNAPLFVNPAAGNYRLRPDSPCIDAGTNLSPSITHDLDGRPRPLDGNGDGLAALDMGAYEYRPPLLVWQDSPNPSAPHADWATAAHTIQDAVDAAVAGDEIVVTNGIYASGGRATVDDRTMNRAKVDKTLALRSVNGSQFTTIDGGRSNRCVFLGSSASLSGFTLTNGRAPVGGGLWCESTNAVVSNCVVSGNSSFGQRPDFLATGFPCCNRYITLAGGVYGGTLNDCTLSDNGAETHSFLGHTCDRTTCRTVGDGSFQIYYSTGAGGGAANAILKNCTLTANWAGFGGGAYGCALNNCTLTGNHADAVYISDDEGGISRFGGYGGGAYSGTVNNCIVYFNTAPDGPNFDYSFSILNYSCTTPLPTNGVGNITNEPAFVDLASGNLRLLSNSPCINAGKNTYAPGAADLDGNSRIKGGTVDIGAYEFQSPASTISYAWLRQFNLPIALSTDTADLDGDGLNNWQEWRCGTDPTNALSTLRLLAPAVAGSDILVRWESVADRTYFLERSESVTSAFMPLAAEIPGLPNTTIFTVTNAIGTGLWFYRVGVSTP